MAVDASKVYRELDSGQRHIKDLSRDELLAVKNYVTFQGRKSETTTQPLQATKKGQEQLAKQVAPKPKAKKKVTTPKPSPTRTPSPASAPTALRPEVEAALAPTQAQAPQRNLTWGEELNQYLTQKFPEAYPSAKRTVGLALEANPFLKTTLGAFGAPGTSAVDIAAEKISPTGTKTIGEKLSEQYGNFATGVSQNIQQQLGKGNTFPNVLEALSAGFGTMEQKARPALDVTRGIYEQSAIASRGLTPEQARAESAAWVARNPNAAGASANILGEALDPLNVPIGGAVAKVAKAAKAIKPKIAEVVTPKKAQPAPAGSLQQPIIDVGVRRPELPGQVQEQPAPVQKTPPKAIEAPKLPRVKSTKTLTKKEQQEAYGNLFGKTKTKKVQGKLTYVSPERAKAQQVYADMFDNPEKYTKPKQQPGQLALEAPKDAGVAKAQQRIAQFNEYLRKKYASVLAKGERPTHEQVLASWKTFTKGRGQGFVDTFKQAYPEPKAVEGAAKPLRQEAPKVNLGVKADTVVRKTDAGYEVIEAKTGRVLGTGTKQSDAVKAAKESIAKITKEVNATRKKIKANDTKIAEYEGYLQNELMSSSHAYLRKEVDRLKSENQTMQTALDKDASLLGKGQKPKPKPKQEPTPPKEEVEKAFKAVVEEQKPQPKPATEPKGKGKPKPEQKVAPQIAEDLAPKPPVKQQAQKPEAKNEREEFIETATARLEQDLKGGAKPSPKPKAVDETAKLAEYEKRKASGKPEDQLDPDEQKEYEALKAKVKKPATEDAMEVIRKSFDEDFEPTSAKDKPTVADNIAEDLEDVTKMSDDDLKKKVDEIYRAREEEFNDIINIFNPKTVDIEAKIAEWTKKKSSASRTKALEKLRDDRGKVEKEKSEAISALNKKYGDLQSKNKYYQEYMRRSKVKNEQKQNQQKEIEMQERSARARSLGGYQKIINDMVDRVKKAARIASRKNVSQDSLRGAETDLRNAKINLEDYQESAEYFGEKVKFPDLQKIYDDTLNEAKNIDEEIDGVPTNGKEKQTIFYIHQKAGGFKPVEGKKVDILEGVNTFVHKVEDGYAVSEVNTGLKLSPLGAGGLNHKTAQAALEATIERIKQIGEDKVRQTVQNALKNVKETAPEPFVRNNKTGEKTSLGEGKPTKKGSQKPKNVAESIEEDLGKKPEPKDPAKSPLVQKALNAFNKQLEKMQQGKYPPTNEEVTNMRRELINQLFDAEELKISKKYGAEYKKTEEYSDLMEERSYFRKQTSDKIPEKLSREERAKVERKKAEDKKDQEERASQDNTIRTLSDKDIEYLAKTVSENADPRFMQEWKRRQSAKGVSAEKMRENADTLAQFFLGTKESLPIEKQLESDEFKSLFKDMGYPDELFDDYKEYTRNLIKLDREYIDVTELGAKDKKREKEYEQKAKALEQKLMEKVNAIDEQKKGKTETKQDLAQRINQKLQEENDKESLSKKMSQGFIPQLFRSKTSKRREGLKSKDQDVEAFSTATAHQGFVRGRVEALKKIGTDLKEGFKDIFRAYNGAPNDVREDLFEGERKLARSVDEAEKTIKNMVAGLKSEYDMDLFQRILVLRDAKATLDASDVVDVPMPFGLKKDQIVPELRRLYAEMKGNKEVRSAIRKYDSVMKAIFEDLVDRGVLPKEARRTFYFPHKIMEYAHGISAGAGRKLDTPFRGYTLAREGSTKPYETDFVKVMRDVLTKVYSDNYISDTLNKVLDKADRLNEFSANDLVNLIGGKNVKSAQEANVPHITKSAWTSNRAQELMDEGMDDKSAMKQANAEWVPHEKSVKSKFFARKFAEFKEAGVEETEIAKMVTQAWNEYMKQPKITVQVLDGKTVIVKNGERFKFFSPKGSNKVYLVSEKMHNILNEFGTPLHENVYAQMFGDAVQFFKTSALTISAPARIVVDTISNARKLLQRDIGAFKYLPRAVRLMIRTSSVKDIRFLKQLAEAGLKGDVKKLDDKTLQFALKHEIIEPTESIRGVYAFTPRWKKFVRYVLDPRSYATYSKNITQRADEFFKLMKASADFDRIENGGYANSAGVIDLEGIDDKYVQASKIAHEFFVNPMRQSRGMRKIFTQGLMPFLNWAAVDTIHAFRYMKNNKMKSILWTGVFATSMAAWNNTGERRKIEEMLPPDRRQIPHLITGYKDDKGRPIIFYLPFAPGLTAMTGTGLAKIPQNIVDAGMESTIPGKEKRAWSDIYTPSEAISSVSKTAVGFMNPLAKVPIEQYYNESMYTGLPIVKRSEEGTGVELAKRLEYTLNQILPPYRAFTGVQQEAAKLTEEEATEQEKKAPAWQNLQKSLAKTFDPLKRVVKAEDMTKLAEEGLKRLEKTRTIQKNNAYQAILDALPAALESDNYDSVFRIAQQIGLTERELKTYARLHEVEVLQKAMKITKDAKKRESYKKQIEALKEKSAVGTAKRAGQVNQEQAEYFLEIRKGGEK